MVAKRGTTAFHAETDSLVRVEEQTPHVGGTQSLKDGDTAISVLAEFFGVLDGLDAGVKAVYVDRGFYDTNWSHAVSGAQFDYLILVIWEGGRFSKSSEGCCRVIQHDRLTGNSTVTATDRRFSRLHRLYVPKWEV